MYGNADFRVTTDSAQYGSLLFTHIVTSQCGEPGDYTVIPESFIKDLENTKTIYGQDLGEKLYRPEIKW